MIPGNRVIRASSSAIVFRSRPPSITRISCGSFLSNHRATFKYRRNPLVIRGLKPDHHSKCNTPPSEGKPTAKHAGLRRRGHVGQKSEKPQPARAIACSCDSRFVIAGREVYWKSTFRNVVFWSGPVSDEIVSGIRVD